MEKYITKFDYQKSHGFQVRVPELIDGVLQPYRYQNVNKFFRKGAGTWTEALDKAIMWRDKYLAKNNLNHLLSCKFSRAFPMTSSACNTSGVIGIALQANYKASDVYFGYKAYWSKDGKQQTKHFSTNLYGECDAFLMACRLRFRHAGVLIITDIKAVPCLPDVEYTMEKNMKLKNAKSKGVVLE